MFTTSSFKEKVRKAIDAISLLLQNGRPCISAWSSGKDSSVSLSLVLIAALEARQKGHSLPPIIVSHGDTTVENPEIRAYADAEIQRVKAFAQAHGLPLNVSVARPNLAESWQVRVIGGRALPSFPGTNHDCSMDLKIRPMNRLRNNMLGKGMEHSITVIGTRFEESPARAARMTERGETPYQPWQGDDGMSYLSPIAEFTMDDVWEFLGRARAGEPGFRTFSDFDDLFRIYADSSGSSCAVVGDMASAGKSKPCGARTGCWCCTPVGIDKSLTAMIEGDERYAYMRGLNRLQRFLVNTRWDLSRRNWLGRSVDDDGYVAIAPDVYSPDMLRDLLRMAVTLDVEEQDRAARANEAPRFEIIDLRTLVAIDAHWNLQGYHLPFEAWRVWKDIYEEGARYPVPEVAETPRPKKIPKPRYLHVGREWSADTQLIGLRDLCLELTSEPGSGCMGTRTTADGRTVLDMNSGLNMDVDLEGALDFVQFELDDQLRRKTFNPTEGYLYYARTGFLSIARQSYGVIDEILRRTWWKWHNGCFGQMSPDQLIARSVAVRQQDLFRKAA